MDEGKHSEAEQRDDGLHQVGLRARYQHFSCDM